MFMQIELSKDWKKVTPISKGWSSDKKYLVETADGKLQLLRISDIDAYEAKKKEYEIITKYSRLDSYFNDDVPEDFWTTNAVYVAQASLFSIYGCMLRIGIHRTDHFKVEKNCED